MSVAMWCMSAASRASTQGDMMSGRPRPLCTRTRSTVRTITFRSLPTRWISLQGPRSQEVSTAGTPFVAPMSLTSSEPAPTGASPAAAAKRADSFDTAQTCAETATRECYTVRTLLQTSRPITGLAAASDDRVFFIDSGQQIIVIVEGRLAAFPALTIADTGVRLSGTALDSAFTKPISCTWVKSKLRGMDP